MCKDLYWHLESFTAFFYADENVSNVTVGSGAASKRCDSCLDSFALTHCLGSTTYFFQSGVVLESRWTVRFVLFKEKTHTHALLVRHHIFFLPTSPTDCFLVEIKTHSNFEMSPLTPSFLCNYWQMSASPHLKSRLPSSISLHLLAPYLTLEGRTPTVAMETALD